MAAKTPPQIAVAAAESGAAKASQSPDKLIVSAFLAGAYIAFASLVAVVVSAGLNPQVWGGVQTLVTGFAFVLGLVLVVIAGSDLVTGNFALVPLAVLSGRVKASRVPLHLAIVIVGNLLGSLFVAYFMAKETGVVTADAPLARLGTLATAKAETESIWQIFLRGVGCNWLVCLAVWMAIGAEDIGGKVLAIFFPIMAFVAMGFDHVVANMFFLPAAHFAGVDGIGWGDVLKNLVFAGIGNFVGAGVFVAGAYYYLYLKDTPPAQTDATTRAASSRADAPGTGARA